ncbi:MAG TPA: hypothetical protein PK257_02220 [Candidatus Woesebacteria bacterium]|nr:hypothetical protein [Candidatus Woesebacteria bacterium]
MNIEQYNIRQQENEGINFTDSLWYFLGNQEKNKLTDTGVFFLNELVKEILKNENEMQLGGSAAEVLSGLITPEEYWGIKGQFKKLNDNLSQKNGEENKIIKSALETLANGDVDFDFYVSKEDHLETIFDNIYKEWGEQTQIQESDVRGSFFEIKITEKLKANIFYGPIYEGSLIKRVCLQLKDNEEKRIFHMDITSNPETGSDQAIQRRHFIGEIHDNCRGKLVVDDNQIKIIFDKNQLPKANQESTLKIDKKSEKTKIEVTLREMRKKIMHFDSNKNKEGRKNFEISRLFPLMNVDSLFDLREMSFGEKPKIEEIFQKQKPAQKQMIYQELFLMAQKDPFLTVIFLQDSGLDLVFFGRHLERKEALALMASEHLKYDLGNNSPSQTIKNSREKYLDLKENDSKKNGLKRLIAAIGQVLSKEKTDFDEHFEEGWKILIDPKNKVTEVKQREITTELKETERKIFEKIIYGGGLTERRLNGLIEINKKEFKKALFNLKKKGLVEAARREVLMDGEKRGVYFYYPCWTETKIETILEVAGKSDLISKIYKKARIENLEAALAIKTEELQTGDFWDKIMALFHPHLILKLITYQNEIEKEGKFKRYYLDRN